MASTMRMTEKGIPSLRSCLVVRSVSSMESCSHAAASCTQVPPENRTLAAVRSRWPRYGRPDLSICPACALVASLMASDTMGLVVSVATGPLDHANSYSLTVLARERIGVLPVGADGGESRQIFLRQVDRNHAFGKLSLRGFTYRTVFHCVYGLPQSATLDALTKLHGHGLNHGHLHSVGHRSPGPPNAPPASEGCRCESEQRWSRSHDRRRRNNGTGRCTSVRTSCLSLAWHRYNTFRVLRRHSTWPIFITHSTPRAVSYTHLTLPTIYSV